MDPKQRIAIIKRTEFALTITKHVMLNTAKDTNLVFSPYSILGVLSLIAAGSKGPILDKMLSCLNSESAQQQIEFYFEFIRVLFRDWNNIGGPKVSFVNGVWIDQSLSVDPFFKNAVETVYESAMNQVDFRNKANEVATEVNLWAEKETNSQIKEVLPPGLVDDSTKLVFVNANYFKGVWRKKFNLSEIKEDDFHLLDGSSVRVPFMTTKKRQFISIFDGFKVLGLTYYCGTDMRRFTVLFYLPDAADGLPSLVRNFCADAEFLQNHIPCHVVNIGDFKLPKFKISFGFEASDVLKDLGLLLPSSGEEDLTEATDSAAGVNLLVSSIYHKSVIEVNEDGREASAAAEAVLAKLPTPTPFEVDFVANHPFMFVIRDFQTGVSMVIGHVYNPLDG